MSNLRSRRLEPGDIFFEVSGGSKGQPVGRALLVTPQLLSLFGNDSVICDRFDSYRLGSSRGVELVLARRIAKQMTLTFPGPSTASGLT